MIQEVLEVDVIKSVTLICAFTTFGAVVDFMS